MNATYTTKPCPRCGTRREVELDVAKVARWTQGAYIQIVWPDMDDETREWLITGYCSPCWELDFGESEDGFEGDYFLNSEAVNQ